MSLSQFLLVWANVFFLFGLCLYVQLRQGPVFALSSAGALLVMVGAWVVDREPDPWLAALFPGLVATGYFIGAGVCLLQAEERPDFYGKAVTMILIGVFGAVGVACALVLEWPVRWG